MRKTTHLCSFLTVLGILVFSISFNALIGQTRFRPESEREAMGQTSAYEEFIKTEKIPIYRGQALPSLMELKLEPWKRLGAQGAYVVLDGSQGMVDSFVCEIPTGGKTQPQKHFFEENIMILSGEGETRIWVGDNKKKQTIRWKRGSVFAPPLNTWHEHVNNGSEPARFVTVTNAPFLMDYFHDANLLFNIEADVKSRYNGEANYFDPEISKDYAPHKGKHSLSIVNMVRDVRSSMLSSAGQGWGDVDRHYVLSQNRTGTHVEAFPVGTYERGHRHGPGAAIVFLSGTGYSLYWHTSLGDTPFSDGKGDQVHKVDWQDGTIFVPANQWYHQHFNTGKEPARFIKLGSPRLGGGNVVFKMQADTRKEGTGYMSNPESSSYMIRYGEEDPKIREMFEADLKRNGSPINMPSREKLAELEEKAEKEDGGMLQNVSELEEGH